VSPNTLERADHRVIARLVTEGCRVLDLGCGDGELLRILRDEKGALVRGVELDLDDISTCISKGLSVIQADLDEGLAGFPDRSFDWVIMSQTVQVLRNPRLAIREMLRVGDRGAISFPNFGHWSVRSYLAFKGRMPVSSTIPYEWYDTPNIHHTTITDFRRFLAANGAVIEREVDLRVTTAGGREVGFWPNLLADSAVMVARRAE
jgi:methionine biosynthesis protein MetW